MLEALLGTLIGVVLAGVGISVGKSAVVDPSLKNLYESQLLAPIKSSDIWVALPIVGVFALIFAALTAQITLRAYVRK